MEKFYGSLETSIKILNIVGERTDNLMTSLYGCQGSDRARIFHPCFSHSIAIICEKFMFENESNGIEIEYEDDDLYFHVK